MNSCTKLKNFTLENVKSDQCLHVVFKLYIVRLWQEFQRYNIVLKIVLIWCIVAFIKVIFVTFQLSKIVCLFQFVMILRNIPSFYRTYFICTLWSYILEFFGFSN